MIKILVASHDAGGANILASLVYKYKNSFQWLICLSGSAKAIFSLKNFNSYPNIQFIKYNNVRKILTSFQPSFVLTGTGWESNFEKLFLQEAKKARIRSSAFLDHWGNYRERFGDSRDWKKNLPDYIFVGDKWAYKIALSDGFPKNKLIQVENPYFEEMIKQAMAAKIKKSLDKKIHILYISEPISEHALLVYNNSHHWGYTEYDIVKYMIFFLKQDINKNSYSLKIRFHPAEKQDKYNILLSKFKNIFINKKITLSDPFKNLLIKDCSESDIVIGSNSMALVIALFLGKKTISFIPKNGKQSSLPQAEILKAASFKELNNMILKKNYNQVDRNKIYQEYNIHTNLFRKTISKIIK